MTINYRSLILNKKSLSYELAQYIKSQIVEGYIPPGSQVNVQEIVKHLEISQTPVREAIQHLVGENIIINVRNKGYFVKKYNENDIFEIYSLRAMLEAFAIRLATHRASNEEVGEIENIFQQMIVKMEDDSVVSITNDSIKIHDSIFKMSKHERLINVNETISFQVAIVNSILGTKYTKKKEVEEHRELIESIKERDPDNAEKVMRNHIFRSYKNFLDTDENNYFTKSTIDHFPI
ncbi:GntR family transcriptional regulator [Virgibacillus sp. W0430]|uniref:GntR family transcriptional regulator n=1 Tax=Virgibacillus sp. W0430 TaxID=3391580 RepID=UPI003F47176C